MRFGLKLGAKGKKGIVPTSTGSTQTQTLSCASAGGQIDLEFGKENGGDWKGLGGKKDRRRLPSSL